ncbi:MAG: transketolase, partial [Candidatus Goldbacteria bacterium]|nr:transketolase [Candidatus Goldiibacteriota bacterium]
IRKRVLKYTIKNNGGYLSQACSSAEILATLYVYLMNLGEVTKPIIPPPFPGVPSTENKNYFRGTIYHGGIQKDKDRFILSPTHYSLALYACLIETGRLDEKGLEFFNKDGSSVEMIGAEHSPGMEVMTGSLGQGISQAAGIALGKKLKKENGTVWLLMSDGEFQIGQVWEAIQFMSYYKLDNMKIIIDVNKHQCDGKVENVMNIEPLDKRLEAFGAAVFKVYGHNINEIANRAETTIKNKPLFIIAETNPWQGIEILKKNLPKLHFIRFKSEEEKMEYEEILKKLETNR